MASSRSRYGVLLPSAWGYFFSLWAVEFYETQCELLLWTVVCEVDDLLRQNVSVQFFIFLCNEIHGDNGIGVVLPLGFELRSWSDEFFWVSLSCTFERLHCIGRISISLRNTPLISDNMFRPCQFRPWHLHGHGMVLMFYVGGFLFRTLSCGVLWDTMWAALLNGSRWSGWVA